MRAGLSTWWTGSAASTSWSARYDPVCLPPPCKGGSERFSRAGGFKKSNPPFAFGSRPPLQGVINHEEEGLRKEKSEPAVPSRGARGGLHLRLRPGAEGRE